MPCRWRAVTAEEPEEVPGRSWTPPRCASSPVHWGERWGWAYTWGTVSLIITAPLRAEQEPWIFLFLSKQ
jgi:hypothetical protein